MAPGACARFSFDHRARQANGQHIHSFGGVWSVLVVHRDRSAALPVSPPPPYGPLLY